MENLGHIKTYRTYTLFENLFAITPRLNFLILNTFIFKLKNAWLQNGYVSSKRELFPHCKCLLKLEFTFTEYGEHINRALLYVKPLVRNFCKGLSVNWSVSKQYMDFLHSLWACSKRLCFVGPWPVLLFFFLLSDQRVVTLSGYRERDTEEGQPWGPVLVGQWCWCVPPFWGPSPSSFWQFRLRQTTGWNLRWTPVTRDCRRIMPGCPTPDTEGYSGNVTLGTTQHVSIYLAESKSKVDHTAYL